MKPSCEDDALERPEQQRYPLDDPPSFPLCSANLTQTKTKPMCLRARPLAVPACLELKVKRRGQVIRMGLSCSGEWGTSRSYYYTTTSWVMAMLPLLLVAS